VLDSVTLLKDLKRQCKQPLNRDNVVCKILNAVPGLDLGGLLGGLTGGLDGLAQGLAGDPAAYPSGQGDMASMLRGELT